MKYENSVPTCDQLLADLAEFRKEQQNTLAQERANVYLSLVNTIFEFQQLHPLCDKIFLSYKCKSARNDYLFSIRTLPAPAVREDGDDSYEQFLFMKEYFSSLEDIKAFLEAKGFEPCRNEKDKLEYVL